MKFSVLILLVLVGIGWYVNDWSGGKFTAIPPAWIALILIVALLHFLIEPLRWQVYLSTHENHKTASVYYIFFCAAFLTYILPAKLGLPFRYWLITRRLNLSGTTTAVYMAMDSAMSIMIWTVASLFFGGSLVYLAISQHLLLSGYFVVGGAGALIVILAAYRASRKWTENWLNRLKAPLTQINPYSLAIISGLFLFEIAVFVMLHAAILAALAVPFIGWQAIAAATVLSMYAGFLSMLPMGLVGYDASIILLLSQYGVGMESAVMVPLIYRAAILLISVGLGLPSSLKFGLGLDFKAIAAKVGQKGAN